MKTTLPAGDVDSNVLRRTIKDWSNFFKAHQGFLTTRVSIVAQGGTIDSVKNEVNKLTPTSHPVTIERTRNLSAQQIASLFAKNAVSMGTLQELYPWCETHAKEVVIPWKKIQLAQASRISSFDSSQEQAPHFVAALYHSITLLEDTDVVLITQGTDSLVNKAAFFAVTLSAYLYASKKKIVFISSPESGYVENSLAIPNLTVGLYIGLEKELPGGVYIATSSRHENRVNTHVLPALGSVKLHADGFFHAPNSGSILTVSQGKVVKTSLCDDLQERVKNIGLLPYLSKFYLKISAIDRLEMAFKRSSIETVDNDAEMLDAHYRKGKRVFIIRARGAGNAPDAWKEAIKKIIKRMDTTVVIITLADSGDVNLSKYAAGLDIPGVLSGRTLREEAAVVLGAIAHDLKQNEGYTTSDLQQLIERYCYLAGMVSIE